MTAYADIRNNGDKTIVLKGVELVAGDVSLNPKPMEYLHTGALYRTTSGALLSVSRTMSSKTRSFVENGDGTHVYQLSMPSPVALPPYSLKSLEFLTPNVTVKSFATYSSIFLPYNVSGKLYKTYNLTSCETFLPAGRLVFREQGRFVGQVNLPDLSINENYTINFGYDSDVNYRREVEVLDGDVDGDRIIYEVKYFFENINVSRDIRVYFSESFSLFNYYQIKNISTSKDTFDNQDSYLRGSIYLPRQSEEKMISYQLFIYKDKPTTTNSDEE